eukprot:SAG31_NODE_40055_length_283_cov_1.130435_1_plen_41_part_10
MSANKQGSARATEKCAAATPARPGLFILHKCPRRRRTPADR